MRVDLSALATAFVVGITAFALAAPAQERLPSILEMIRVTEAKLVEASEAANATDYDRAPTGRRVNFRPVQGVLIAQAEARIKMLENRNRHIDVAQAYERMEQFQRAEVTLRQIMQTGSVGGWGDQGDLVLRAGVVEAMLAALAGYRQNDRLRQRYLAEARERFEPYQEDGRLQRTARTLIKSRIEIAEALPEINRRAAALQTALAAKPNADMQLELALLFARDDGPEVYCVQFLRAAMDFKYMYPAHPAHAEGIADDLLARAFILHEMFDQAIEHINKAMAENPDGGFVTSGSALYRLTRSYELRGWQAWNSGEREAARADFALALANSKRIEEEYPKSRWIHSARAITNYLTRSLRE